MFVNHTNTTTGADGFGEEAAWLGGTLMWPSEVFGQFTIVLRRSVL